MNCFFFFRIPWFSENNEKLGKDYTQQVGICFICRMNCPILPHFLQNSRKKAKKWDKDWMWRVRLYSSYRMNILRFYPVYPEFTHVRWTLNRTSWERGSKEEVQGQPKEVTQHLQHRPKRVVWPGYRPRYLAPQNQPSHCSILEG